MTKLGGMSRLNVLGKAFGLSKVCVEFAFHMTERFCFERFASISARTPCHARVAPVGTGRRAVIYVHCRGKQNAVLIGPSQYQPVADREIPLTCRASDQRVKPAAKDSASKE